MVDLSAVIREEFTQFQLLTTDGRVLAGLLEEQMPTLATIRGVNNQLTVVSRDDVEILKATKTSIVPDGVTQKLTTAEILNFFLVPYNAYTCCSFSKVAKFNGYASAFIDAELRKRGRKLENRLEFSEVRGSFNESK